MYSVTAASWRVAAWRGAMAWRRGGAGGGARRVARHGGSNGINGRRLVNLLTWYTSVTVVLKSVIYHDLDLFGADRGHGRDAGCLPGKEHPASSSMVGVDPAQIAPDSPPVVVCSGARRPVRPDACSPAISVGWVMIGAVMNHKNIYQMPLLHLLSLNERTLYILFIYTYMLYSICCCCYLFYFTTSLSFDNTFKLGRWSGRSYI